VTGPVGPTRRTLLLTSASAALASVALTPAARAAEVEPQRVHIDDPPPGKAVIVFYRRWDYPDIAISYIVREGQAELGRLSNASYFVSVVDPGLHTYTVHAERHDDMQIEVEAGEIYYVRFELDIGIILYQPSITPSEQRLFDELSPKLKRSEPLTPPATTPKPAAAPGGP
jgi:hypothetical protein